MKLTKIKHFALFSFCMFFSGLLLFAQSPEKVSYQSVIRDASGELIRSQSVGIKISILQGSTSGTVVYVETHTPTTNINGLASVEIGTGTSSDTFSDIDWSNGPYFLKVETDPAGGTSYSISGISEILSVPFSLLAKSVKGPVDADNNVVTNVADPVDGQDAATKAYVDILEAKIAELENTNKAGGGIIDGRDGNYYNTVKIGDQVWMAENLAYLPAVGPTTSDSYTDPYYFVYDYDGEDVSEAKATDNYQTYGVLYNWAAAENACPGGWHLPDSTEWAVLFDFLIANGYNYDGTTVDNKIAKSMATVTGWTTSATEGAVGNTDYPEAKNKSGFSALPGGYRGTGGAFNNMPGWASWWSTEYSTERAYGVYISTNSVGVNYPPNYNKRQGLSVRCVKD